MGYVVLVSTEHHSFFVTISPLVRRSHAPPPIFDQESLWCIVHNNGESYGHLGRGWEDS